MSGGIRHLARLLLVAVGTVGATAALVAGDAALGAVPPLHADERSFSLVSLDTTADVRADGSMQVTEVITYDFDGGPFNFGIRTFERDLERVSDFAAADPDGPLTVIDPLYSESGQWEWQLRAPTTDRTITFTLTYRVRQAVSLGKDVGDLNWQFVGTEHPGIGRVRIVVQIPRAVPPAEATTPDADTTVLRGFAHGPLDGLVQVEPTGVIATVDDVAAGQFVEVRVVLPISSFTAVGSVDRLPGILAEERRLADDDVQRAADEQERRDRRDRAITYLPIVSGLAFLGTAATWIAFGRERRSTEVQGDYWREPLDDPPAVVLTNLRRGSVPVGEAFAGTLVDLAQRGYLRVEAERDERIGPDRTVHHYRWLGKAPGGDVLGYEQTLLDLVFRGRTEADSDELREWATAHQKTAKSKLDSFEGGVLAENRRRDYEASGNSGPKIALTVLCALTALASFLLRNWTDHGIMWVGVGISAVMLVLGQYLLRNRTQAGVEAAAKAEGLRRFLRDFSRLEDAPIGHLILWDRYLVYAVTLGVSDQLLEGLGSRLPALVADPAFGAWYVGAGGGPHRFDGFDGITSLGPSIVRASTPKSSGGSGSGGGFSGGSSGGGGGGGFGAR